MAKDIKVRLLKQVKVNGRWVLARALFDTRNKIRNDYVHVNGKDELHREGTYYLEWYGDGKRHREAAGADGNQAQETARLKQATLAGIAAGIVVEPAAKAGKASGSLKVSVEKFLEHVRAWKRPGTQRFYSSVLRHFCDFAKADGVTDLTEVNREFFLRYMLSLKKRGLKNSTIKTQAVPVLTALKSAGISSLLQKQDWPKIPRNIRDVYGAEQIEQVLAHTSPQNVLLFKFILNTGFRNNEVQHTSWRDIDVANSTVSVTAKPWYDFVPKTSNERVVAVAKKLIDALLLAKPKNARADDLVFPNKKGRPNRYILTELKEAAYRAGLNCGRCITKFGNKCSEGPFCTLFYPHKFRHTFATRQLQDGHDIVTVGKWMGHEDIGSTQIYTKAQKNRDVQARIDGGTLAAFV